jgi:hypothetical protein
METQRTTSGEPRISTSQETSDVPYSQELRDEGIDSAAVVPHGIDSEYSSEEDSDSSPEDSETGCFGDGEQSSAALGIPYTAGSLSIDLQRGETPIDATATLATQKSSIFDTETCREDKLGNLFIDPMNVQAEYTETEMEICDQVVSSYCNSDEEDGADVDNLRNTSYNESNRGQCEGARAVLVSKVI